MAGHSKWDNIKHRKAAQDAKKGQLFSKLIKEIIVAARTGGGDPEANVRLRHAIEAAKEANVPKDKIETAIKKGTGEIAGEHYEEMVFEGYGPGGVAVLVEALTDNRNRTASEVRSIFSRHGGNLGESGCVSWIFHRKGLITVRRDACSEEEIMDASIEGGAEDYRIEDDMYTIITAPQDLASVKEVLQAKGIPIEMAKLTMVPTTSVHVEGKTGEQLLKLLDALEECPDVQNVYANFEIPDELLEALISGDES